MKVVYQIFHFIKPIIPMVIIVGGLQLTGQLDNVTTFGQTAVLKAGLMNAGTETEVTENFDYNFKAVCLDGSPLKIDSLKGKVIFLNLWATWCGPCRSEMPTIQSLHDKINNPNVVFVIMAIDPRESLEKIGGYIHSKNFTFPVYKLSGQPTEQLKVSSIPTTFIISKEGKIIHVETGMTNFNTEQFKKFLLKEAAR